MKKEFNWWPHYVVSLAIIMVLLIGLESLLAVLYPVPDDAPDEIPLPDEGMNIPGPEWLFLVFWTPFWYFKGFTKKYLFITAIVPLLITIWLFMLPYMHKIPWRKIPPLGKILDRAKGMQQGFKKSLLYASPVLVLAVFFCVMVFQMGHHAKLYGCDSCHNPAMGPRMAIPPVNVAKYYNVERAMQIQVGKYRAGKSTEQDASGEMLYSSGGETGYKDANWQLRHMYEPTFTW